MVSQKFPQDRVGLLLLFFGIVLFSTVEISGKIIGSRVDPILLTFLRFSCTGVLLFTVSCIKGHAAPWRLWSRDGWFLLLNGVIGIGLAVSLFHYAIIYFEKAASSAVVFSANPVFVVLLARFINGESWSWRKWCSVLSGTVGVLFFAWESGSFSADSMLGLGLMLLAAFFFALGVCLSKRLIPFYGALRVMGASSLLGSLAILPLVIIRFSPDRLPGLADAWLPVLYMVFIGTTVAYLLYYMGVGRTSAYQAGTVFFFKPIIASLLAIAVLNETINIHMLFGTAFILVGMVLAMLQSRPALEGVK